GDDAPDGQVVVGVLGGPGRRATGVVVAQGHGRQVGQVAGLLGLLEVLLPDVRAVLVRDRRVEVRVVVIADRVQRRHVRDPLRGVLRHGQRALRLAFQDLGVGVVLLPGALLAGRGRLVLAVVRRGAAGGLDGVPDEAAALVGKGVPTRVRVATRPGARRVLRLVVVVVTLNQPLVAVRGQHAAVVEVVEQRERVGQAVLVRRHGRPIRVVRRAAVALRQITEDLVVGAVLLDDQEDVLDRRRLAELVRDRGCDAAGGVAASGRVRHVPG